MELLRNHVVTSTAVSSHLQHLLLRPPSSVLCPSSFCFFLFKLDVFNLVSTPRLVSLANQVLTVNVTENVSVEVA